MIYAGNELFPLPAQREDLGVIMPSDLFDQSDSIVLRDRMTHDHQIEIAVAAMSCRLGKAQGGGDSESRSAEEPFPRAQKGFVIRDREDRRGPIRHSARNLLSYL